MTFPCPHCQYPLLVTTEPAARARAECPQCGKAVQFPQGAPGETTGLPPSAESGTLSHGEAQTSSCERPSIAGYEVLEEVGRGGMGVVYKARQTKLKRVVALKMILAGAHASREDLARFRREAEAAAQLQHPNIVQVYEIGEQQNIPFLVLEFVEGGNLAQRLPETRPSSREAAALIEVLARTVQVAHDRGIVHRDLKPANILLASGGPCVTPEEHALAGTPSSGGSRPPLAALVPKITDFGLAKQVGTGDASAPGYRTASGAILGTPNYMAPEQASGKNKEIGPSVDIYALGAILYELLTGRPPFHADTPLDTVLRVLSEEPVSPRRLNVAVPRDLETVCLKCLEKRPRNRYATAGELADDLRRFLDDEPIRARRVTRVEQALRWVKRRKAMVVAVVLLALCLGLALAFLPWGGGPGPVLPASGEEEKVALPADLDLVPRDALGFASVRVGDLLGTDLLARFQRQLLKENPALAEFLPLRDKGPELEQKLGLNPLAIERATLVMLSPSLEGSGLVILGLTKPVDRKTILDRLLGKNRKEDKFLGRSYHTFEQGDAMAVHFASDQVMVIATSLSLLKQFLGRVPRPDASGELRGPLERAAGKSMMVAALNPPSLMVKDWAKSVPLRFDMLKHLLHFQSAVLALDLKLSGSDDTPAGAFGVDLQFGYPDADQARQAETAAHTTAGPSPNEFRKELLAGTQKFLNGLINIPSLTDPLLRPIEQALENAAVRCVGPALHLLLEWKVEVPKGPAVASDIEKAAQRVSSANNLRQLAIAMINYNAVYNYLPTHAIYSKDGKPLLSWRVALLPFIEADLKLYNQFKLDEPWDSPHNKKLLAKMPKFYAPVGKTTPAPGLTYYQVFVGKGAVFEGQRKLSLAQIENADGNQNTLLLVEAGEPVPWTKPEDLPFEPGKPLPKLGGLFAEGFHAAFCDNSSLFIPQETPADKLRALITWNGREKVNPRKLAP